VRANQAVFPVRVMCRVLGLSTSGYYAWVKREPSARARRDEALRERIQTIYERNRSVYGRPRIHAELLEEGERIGGKRVARLMAELGIRGASRRRRKPRTTKRDADARPTPDLVERDFTAAGPDRLWVADITYIPTWAGFLYLAVVLDAWSRRVIGWSMATHLRTELVLDALNMGTGDPPLGPGHAVHVHCLRPPVQGGGGTPFHGLRGGRLRQRALRELLRLNHWYHHRGQLVVYLRQLEIPVPAIYGPSADENPFDS